MAETNRALIERFYGLMNAGKIEECAEILAEDCVEHTPPPGMDFPPGRESFKVAVGGWLKAFPDMKMEPLDFVSEGEVVAVRYQWTGTHKGSMMGEEATNKSVTGHGIDMMKIKDGLVTDHWAYGDDAAVMAQLGMTPPGA